VEKKRHERDWLFKGDSASTLNKKLLTDIEINSKLLAEFFSMAKNYYKRQFLDVYVC